MKSNKAAGPSGVVSDMLKAAGEAGTIWVTDLCNAVVRDGKIPEDWCKSWMMNVYKGKGDALVCGSYRGIRLLEHVMKILERVVDARVRRIVKIDDMQFGFMAGKGTTDAIFIVRQLQEKYLAKKKTCGWHSSTLKRHLTEFQGRSCGWHSEVWEWTNGWSP